jgi:ribonucleotide reductase alpha subunit
MLDFFSFKLSPEFLESYKQTEPPFGFKDAATNSLGEITFIRTYSRMKEDGTKERWHEVCKRVVEGMYSVQKNHAKENRLPWNDYKAQKSAQEAYDRLFTLKWTPPGRGLWAFGTPMTMESRNSASLQNCAMVSTRDIDRNDPGALFAWVMDALMLGIGVGFDTLGQDKEMSIYSPTEPENIWDIPDTREGWVDSVRMLLNSYLRPNQAIQKFNYDLIRPLGAPIKGFGGVASGPGPLIALHNKIDKVIGGRAGETLDSRAIVDIVNLIGTCVVSGNVRRSATLALGLPEDKDFINLKNAEVFPDRNSFDSENPGWAWMSNNSISAEVGTKYEDYVDLIVDNGEPGFIWLDVARNYGRLADPADGKDSRIMGFNPCAEQPLESYELCTLVEVHLNRHEDKEDFLRTLKFAYLYGKTVTLMPTHWQTTNGIMQRNRRIGTSLTGIASFADTKGMPTVRQWMDEGYRKIRSYDHSYSEWLCVRESIRVTTV